jgi:hypothetical protein
LSKFLHFINPERMSDLIFFRSSISELFRSVLKILSTNNFSLKILAVFLNLVLKILSDDFFIFLALFLDGFSLLIYHVSCNLLFKSQFVISGGFLFWTSSLYRTFFYIILHFCLLFLISAILSWSDGVSLLNLMTSSTSKISSELTNTLLAWQRFSTISSNFLSSSDNFCNSATLFKRG